VRDLPVRRLGRERRFRGQRASRDCEALAIVAETAGERCLKTVGEMSGFRRSLSAADCCGTQVRYMKGVLDLPPGSTSSARPRVGRIVLKISRQERLL
jgi:hypothetical protein